MLRLWEDTGKLFDGAKSMRTAQSLHRTVEWFGWEWTLEVVPKIDPKQGSNLDHLLGFPHDIHQQ